MLIQSLKTHFPARSLEWWSAGHAITWGFYVATHPQIFVQPATAQQMSGIVDVAGFFNQPPVMIGILALCVGIVRCGALFVNGAVTKTPLVRLLTAFASAYLWTSICIGLWLPSVSNTGLVIYPWLVFADIVSCYRAGFDIVIAESTARQRAAGGQRNNNSGSDSHGGYGITIVS